MPTWLAIVIVVFVLLVAVLAVGGIIGRQRQLARSRAAASTTHLAAVNRELAAAHADDRGWAREGLEAAAREAYAAERGTPPEELTLVQIVDQPGTDDDKAIFRDRRGAAHARPQRRRMGVRAAGLTRG